MSVDVHQAWAPKDGRWSSWVKPVLFAEIGTIEADPGDAELLTLPAADAELEQRILAPLTRQAGSYRDAETKDTALVIDLPGAEGTYLGISLASHGFRPIPLYNAIPSAAGLIDYDSVMAALRAGAYQVSRATTSAPPAFLLDASRLVGKRPAEPGRFDNRSVCRSSDFPPGQCSRAQEFRASSSLLRASNGTSATCFLRGSARESRSGVFRRSATPSLSSIADRASCADS